VDNFNFWIIIKIEITINKHTNLKVLNIFTTRFIFNKKLINKKLTNNVVTEKIITLSKERYLYISIFRKWKPGKLNLISILNIRDARYPLCIFVLNKTNSLNWIVPYKKIICDRENINKILIRKLLNKYNSKLFLYFIKLIKLVLV